jgi:16S rRNA processing protein RimM
MFQDKSRHADKIKLAVLDQASNSLTVLYGVKVMRKQFLEIGVIVSTHGVKGDVRVDPWCDDPAILCRHDQYYLDERGECSIHVLGSKVHGNVVILSLEGVSDISSALPFIRKTLYIDRDKLSLPEGAHFIQDLIGIQVYDADSGRQYGVLTQVLATGANDVYVIKADVGKERLIPAIRDVVIDTDIDSGRMLIRPLKGLFDEEI